MPRFHLNIRDGDALFEDLEGMELPGLPEVRDEMREGAREILAERARLGKPPGREGFEVTDGAGRAVCVLSFLEALAS